MAHGAFPDIVRTSEQAGLPTMEQTTGFTKDIGLTGYENLVPQNDLEKFLVAGAEGAGSGLGLGGPLGILTSITGGLGAQVGVEPRGGSGHQIGGNILTR